MNKTEIKKEVKKEISNVANIIKNLIKIKIESSKLTEDGQKQALNENEKKNDFGNFMNSLNETIDSLKTDFMSTATTTTVSLVREMIKDLSKEFLNQTTGEINSILEDLYNLLPYIDVFLQANNKYSIKKGTTSKDAESRRLSKTLILKFVHDNSKKYLGKNTYPSNTAVAANEIKKKSLELVDFLNKNKVDVVNEMVEVNEYNNVTLAELKTKLKNDQFYKQFKFIPKSKAEALIILGLLDQIKDNYFEDISDNDLHKILKNIKTYRNEDLTALGYYRMQDTPRDNIVDLIYSLLVIE